MNRARPDVDAGESRERVVERVAAAPAPTHGGPAGLRRHRPVRDPLRALPRQGPRPGAGGGALWPALGGQRVAALRPGGGLAVGGAGRPARAAAAPHGAGRVGVGHFALCARGRRERRPDRAAGGDCQLHWQGERPRGRLRRGVWPLAAAAGGGGGASRPRGQTPPHAARAALRPAERGAHRQGDRRRVCSLLGDAAAAAHWPPRPSLPRRLLPAAADHHAARRGAAPVGGALPAAAHRAEPVRVVRGARRLVRPRAHRARHAARHLRQQPDGRARAVLPAARVGRHLHARGRAILSLAAAQATACAGAGRARRGAAPCRAFAPTIARYSFPCRLLCARTRSPAGPTSTSLNVPL
uniref:Uncharacterized protein n=1 Tax=Emiliania huxleyi (strain CCMP1516) TaxID=280463 RepID=A0A0D3K9T5_EMIH1